MGLIPLPKALHPSGSARKLKWTAFAPVSISVSVGPRLDGRSMARELRELLDLLDTS